jgi:acyl-CoA reductase-like NAD-dependent aldehyde dehydrogenase
MVTSATAELDAIESLATVPRPLLIAGEHVEGTEVSSVEFPYDGREIGQVWLADEALLDRALAAADGARNAMAALPPHERAELLGRAAELVRGRGEELAAQMTLETGNAIWETRLEVSRCVEVLRAAGEEARRLTGEMVPIDAWPNGEGRIAWTRHFPVGTVLAITPYNAPLLLVAHKLAPALAAGCPCVVRPASKTPLSALSLGEILVEAGAPAGSVSVVPCRSSLAEQVLDDTRVKAISFTGSCEVGWKIKRLAHTPRVTLELGGNGAVIVHEDADVAYAAKRCAFGGFLRSGQACISVQRAYVHESIFDEFAASFLKEIGALTTGDPLDDSTIVGCLVNDEAADNAIEVIEEARDAGAAILCGGGRTGRVVEPTLLVDAPADGRAYTTEVFGPIVALAVYADIDDAIDQAGDSPFGLQAGIFTNDMRIINRAHERLEVGALIVNDVNTFRVDHMPYGGAKLSGVGREGVRYAMRDLTEERLLVVDPRSSEG